MTIVQQIHVTEDWIRDYAHSINSPIQLMKGKLVAPSTMPVIFWQFFKEHSSHQLPILHGSQKFYYEEPITAGMILDCELILLKSVEKNGKTGKLTLNTYNLTCKCEEKIIVIATTILIRVGETHEKSYHH